MANEVAKLLPLHLPVTSAISVYVTSSSAHIFLCLCFYITKFVCPFVLHEHTTSSVFEIIHHVKYLGFCAHKIISTSTFGTLYTWFYPSFLCWQAKRETKHVN